MSAHVLLNLLNEFGEKRWNVRLAEHFIAFSQRVKKFNNTGARMLDYIYQMILILFWNRIFGVKNVSSLPNAWH